jgi:choloylglycine hydrolase
LGNKLAAWSSPIGTLGVTANWFGDEIYGFPSLFGDSLNEKGLSCSLLTLINSQYEEKASDKLNVFAGLFCHYVATNYDSVITLQTALQDIRIWGPDALAQHFVVRDATGASLVIECVDGVKRVYLDKNDGTSGYGIMTNEPGFDYHLESIKHYEWKRTLSRQAVAIPGNFYPEERFLRVHMVKSGMQDEGYFNSNASISYQQAFSLTSQVLNVITVPMGQQYGTDTGESSGEGSNPDHSVWGVIRDHSTPALFWRDSGNPTFRRLLLRDMDFSEKADRKAIKMQEGAFYIDMKDQMK